MEPRKEISEKEFAVIHEIANNHKPNQRDIAQRTGLSLGLTNLIIKRLVRKGCIKILQLNGRKIEYLLTPKGFSEKTKKSYKYAIKTIRQIKSMNEEIRKILVKAYREGKREFLIIGDNEFAHLIEGVIKDMDLEGVKYEISNMQNGSGDENSKMVLVTDFNGFDFMKNKNTGGNVINMVSFLSGLEM